MSFNECRWRVLAALVAAGLAVAGCSSSDDPLAVTPGTGSSSDPGTDPVGDTGTPDGGVVVVGSGELLEPKNAEGYAQKGPFQAGAQVTVREFLIDGSGYLTGKGRTWTTTTNNEGLISFATLPWEDGVLAKVTVEGPYFDEIANAFTVTPLRLNAMMQVSKDAPLGNVNLFTHLASRYIEYWLEAGGWAYGDLRGWSNDLLAWMFGLETQADQLNLLDNLGYLVNRDSQVLLAYSAAASKLGLTQAQLDAMAEEFALYVEEDAWPAGPGRQAFESLLAEVAENGDALLAQARQNLQSQYGRVYPYYDAFRVGAGICWFSDRLCGDDSYLGGLSVAGGQTVEIPIVSGAPGSYGLLIQGTNQSFAIKILQDSGATIESVNPGPTSFTERALIPFKSNTKYRLSITNGGTSSASLDIYLSKLNEGSPDDPRPIGVGTTDAVVGRTWGGVAQNDQSYYQLVAPAGSYDITISGYPCSASTTPLTMRVRWWDHDMTEPLPAEVAGQDPFVNGTMLASSAEAGCSQTVTVQSEALKPNRIYLTVKSEYPARTTLPDERPNLGNEFRITVTRN